MTNLDRKKVVLGLSGGVDSTAAALLLKEQGFEVIGLFLDVTGTKSEDIKKADAVAKSIGIDFYHKDISDIFNKEIVSYFCESYLNGKTPNPCTRCNPKVKFKQLIETANELGAYYVATGHYAGVFYDEKENLFYIRKGKSKKDQSYMLYRLGQDVVSRVLFPLENNQEKEQTREIARKYATPNSEAKDSQEICFISDDTDIGEYILDKGYTSEKGEFVDRDGKYLGDHRGIVNYTIGQRKKLGIALGKPAFITKIDSETKKIYLGDNQDLFSNTVYTEDNIMQSEKMKEIAKTEGLKITAKIRYQAKPAEAILRFLDNDDACLTFVDAQRAATPGQSCVFYIDDVVIGGGIIK